MDKIKSHTILIALFILQLFLAACGSKHITDTVAQDKKDYDSIQAIKELDDISKQPGKSSEQPSPQVAAVIDKIKKSENFEHSNFWDGLYKNKSILDNLSSTDRKSIFDLHLVSCVDYKIPMFFPLLPRYIEAMDSYLIPHQSLPSCAFTPNAEISHEVLTTMAGLLKSATSAEQVNRYAKAILLFTNKVALDKTISTLHSIKDIFSKNIDNFCQASMDIDSYTLMQPLVDKFIQSSIPPHFFEDYKKVKLQQLNDDIRSGEVIVFNKVQNSNLINYIDTLFSENYSNSFKSYDKRKIQAIFPEESIPKLLSLIVNPFSFVTDLSSLSPDEEKKLSREYNDLNDIIQASVETFEFSRSKSLLLLQTLHEGFEPFVLNQTNLLLDFLRSPNCRIYSLDRFWLLYRISQINKDLIDLAALQKQFFDNYHIKLIDSEHNKTPYTYEVLLYRMFLRLKAFDEKDLSSGEDLRAVESKYLRRYCYLIGSENIFSEDGFVSPEKLSSPGCKFAENAFDPQFRLDRNVSEQPSTFSIKADELKMAFDSTLISGGNNFIISANKVDLSYISLSALRPFPNLGITKEPSPIDALILPVGFFVQNSNTSSNFYSLTFAFPIQKALTGDHRQQYQFPAEAISGGNLSMSVYSNGSNFLPSFSSAPGKPQQWTSDRMPGGFEDKFEFDPQIYGNLNRWTTEDIKEIPVGAQIKSISFATNKELLHSPINWKNLKTFPSTRFIDGLKYEDFHRYQIFCQNMGFPIEFENNDRNFINCLGIVHQKAISWIQDYMSGLNDIDFNGPFIYGNKNLIVEHGNYSGVVTNPSALGQEGSIQINNGEPL